MVIIGKIYEIKAKGTIGWSTNGRAGCLVRVVKLEKFEPDIYSCLFRFVCGCTPPHADEHHSVALAASKQKRTYKVTAERGERVWRTDVSNLLPTW